MASLTSRGKAVAGLAFMLSAVLCAGAAVALVQVSDEEPVDGTAAPKPSLNLPTATPSPSALVTASPSARPTASPTPVVTVSPTASPRPSASATTSSSPRPRATSSPKPVTVSGLAAQAVLDPQSGSIYPTTPIKLTAHATDGKGDIRLRSLDWGDGAVVTGGTGKSCAAPAGGDCADFAFSHNYDEPGRYLIVLELVSGTETAVIDFTIVIQPCAGPCASPTPTPSP